MTPSNISTARTWCWHLQWLATQMYLVLAGPPGGGGLLCVSGSCQVGALGAVCVCGGGGVLAPANTCNHSGVCVCGWVGGGGGDASGG